ncbi:hypothetical protein K8R62_03120 [bacterium]|nr:hypothetical protein [bacterium]
MEKQGDKKIIKWPLVGNSKIPELLSSNINNKKVAGSYIFLGPKNLGKTSLAKFFAQTLLCASPQKDKSLLVPCYDCSSCRQMSKSSDSEALNPDDLSSVHGDFHLIRKEEGKKNISIEQIRDFIKTMSLSSFLNSYKIGIIKNAETLNVQSSNALLKTLEEPRKDVVIILVVSNIENIPLTIVSRSQVINFSPVPSDIIYSYLIENYNIKRSQAKNIARLSLGRPALAKKFLEESDFYQDYIDQAEMFLDILKTDINNKFSKVGNLLRPSSGQENAEDALRSISIWRGLIRDFMLLICGHNDLIQFEVIKEKVELGSKNFDFVEVLKVINLLEISENQIKSNVNPRLVLENTLVNI